METQEKHPQSNQKVIKRFEDQFVVISRPHLIRAIISCRFFFLERMCV